MEKIKLNDVPPYFVFVIKMYYIFASSNQK